MSRISQAVERYDLLTLAFLMVCLYGMYHDRQWFWHRQPMSHAMFRSVAFGCAALGMMAYYLLSLLNDVTGTLPLWIRVGAAVFIAGLVRFGLAYECWHNGRWLRHNDH